MGGACLLCVGWDEVGGPACFNYLSRCKLVRREWGLLALVSCPGVR